jgi:hypothetical protein
MLWRIEEQEVEDLREKYRKLNAAAISKRKRQIFSSAPFKDSKQNYQVTTHSDEEEEDGPGRRRGSGKTRVVEFLSDEEDDTPQVAPEKMSADQVDELAPVVFKPKKKDAQDELEDEDDGTPLDFEIAKVEESGSESEDMEAAYQRQLGDFGSMDALGRKFARERKGTLGVLASMFPDDDDFILCVSFFGSFCFLSFPHTNRQKLKKKTNEKESKDCLQHRRRR